MYRLLFKILSPVLAARHFAYDHGLFSSHSLSVPVISVGNIAFGGTGKTPLVHLIASGLQERMRVAILTRGFRSQIEKSGTVKKISSGDGPLFSAEECGDEPYFLAKKTRASIWVGIDRIASGKKAIEEGAQVLLLDDGMQHRRIRRDVEIVVIDSANPWGKLRDLPERLKYATLIVANHITDRAHYERLQQELTRYTSAPLVGARMEILNKEMFPPRKVGLFCGIGQPARFLQTVRDLNQEIVDTLIVEDHGTINLNQLQRFAESCRIKGADVLVCTEKDYVKLSASPLNIIPVEIKLNITDGIEHWENCINKIVRLSNE